ncbi:MAG TPA: NIPSNAP family protein [Terriglobales bacterium]|nr:NIPSNAP family protein [Terriglobales bacterium]
MKTNPNPALPIWMICAIAVISFAAGSLRTARMTGVKQVGADGNRVFELLIYHAIPGRGPALESLFRDVSRLQAKHGLDVVGYWVPNEDPAWKDTLIYLLAQPSREEATKNWHALHADPEFPPYRKSAEPLIQKDDDQFKVDEVYMRPTDYSTMK